MALQVLQWIRNSDAMIVAGLVCPTCLGEAEALKKEHDQFQQALETTHQTAVKVTKKAETMMEENHYSSEAVRAMAETITGRWQQLMFKAEERMKLVMASNHWFKTAEQVCTVLESLEGEYGRCEDWCESEKAANKDKAEFIAQLLLRHHEQKEGFLRACTLARRTAEHFLKYVSRNVITLGMKVARDPQGQVKATLEHLHKQENTVLEYWTTRKKSLDQCQQYVTFEHSAKQVRHRGGQH